MRTAALALALLAGPAVPTRAFDELFGFHAGDLIAEAHRQRAEYEARLARERAARARGSWFGELIGTVAVARQKPECVFAAVARRMGSDPASERVPAVYYASRTILEDYLAYYYAERGVSKTPERVATDYFLRNNVLFMDDAGRLYGRERSLDDATAGEFARYFLAKKGAATDAAQAAVADTERWFHAQYTAPGKSACAE